MSTLADRAAKLLRGNDRGGYTVPSPRLYPHQWAWDSAFAAIGWSYFDLERGLVEIETLLGGQWPDGRVPHILFHDLNGDYFPGPDFWGTERSSSITQPPMWAEAALRLLRAGADKERLKALVPKIERSHQFFHEQRDPDGVGLICVVHPWESGLDNGPQWDIALEAIDPSKAQEFTRVDKDRVDPDTRPTDDQYKRYAALVGEIARNNFGLSSFQIYDPMMTTVLALAEQRLATLCEELNITTRAGERAEKLRDAVIERLWQPDRKKFGYYDIRARRPFHSEVLASYLPLLLAPPPRIREPLLETIQERYMANWPLPTVAPGTEFYRPRLYWRGPTWINMNWFFCQVPELRSALRARTLTLVDENGFWEYYDATTGEGLGGADFTWSAALTLDLLASEE